MRLLEIKLFPLIRRKVVLDTTKENFISTLEDLRKESYMLFDRYSDGGKHKQYSLRLYSSFFILESLYKFPKILDSFPAFLTKIYGRYKMKDERLELTYYITFDILGILFYLGSLFCLVYFSFEMIKTDSFDYKGWLAIFVLYALFVYGFNDESYGDKKFIERLIKANSKSESKENID